jgi:Ca2+-binding RTX toxin-like protein
VSAEDELVAGISATFEAGDAIDLALGFLSFEVIDVGTNGEFIDWSGFGALGDGLTGSGIVGAFKVNLRDKLADDAYAADPSAANDADRKRLAVSEIGSGAGQNPLSGPEGIIEAGVHVLAEAHLDMSLQLGSGAAFPEIAADFHFEWEFEHTLIGGPVEKTSLGSMAPTIEFLDVRLDLGTFISDVIGPILEEVQTFTQPLEPIIDLLTMRIPGVSDLAGKDITMLDLAGIFGGDRFDPSFIRTLIQIVEVINAIPTDGDSVIIEFGDFHISGPNAAPGGVDLRTGASLSSATPPPDDGFSLDQQVADKGSTQTKGFMSKLGNLQSSGLQLPILTSPSNIFGLLTGQTVDLIFWDVPKLRVDFEYTQSFMVAPGLNARFGGQVFVELDLQLGFDTRGINMFTEAIKDIPEEQDRGLFIASQVPKIFLGLYFGDNIIDGIDHPELVFGVGITAGASVGIGGLVEAGVEGGVFAEIQFDWHDPNHDGKIYLDELASRFLLSPFAIFDTSGEIYAKLYAFLWVGVKVFGAKITLVDETFDIVSKFVIADFNFVFNPENQPVYGSKVGSDLRLNMGVDAHHRLDDGAPAADTPHDGNAAESFEVKKVTLTSTDELVTSGYYTAGEYYHVIYDGNPDKKLHDDLHPMAAPGAKTIVPRLISTSGITRIVANDAGGGDDTILIDPTINVPVSLRGGAGNDLIVYRGSGDALIYGDAGNDELRGGSGVNTIHGGEGNDVIVGGAQGDFLYGGGGNDLIFGMAGDDYIDGGAGNDSLWGGEGNDVIMGGEGNDALMGEAGDDWLDGGAGDDRIEGGEGDDVLIGGAGNDTLTGGEGNDVIVGGEGDDAINWTHGDGIDAFISGGAGYDTFFATASAEGEDISLRAVDTAPTSATRTNWFMGGPVTFEQSNFGLDLDIVDQAGVNAPITLTVTEFEELVIDAREGADTLEIFDLTGTGLTDLRLDLGAANTVQTVTQAVFEADGITPVLVPMTAQVHKRDPVTGLLMYEKNADGSFRLEDGQRIPILTEALVSEVDDDGNAVLQTILADDVDDLGEPIQVAIQVPTVINGTVTLVDGDPVTAVLTKPDGPDEGDDPDPILDANGNPVYGQAFTFDPEAPQVPLLMQQTVEVVIPSGGKDSVADQVILHGGQDTVHGDQSLADDIFALSAGGGEVAITRDMGAAGVMNFTLQNAERAPTTGSATDLLEIYGHAGNDILDAGAIAPDLEAPDDRRDLIAIRLFGDVGDDRLIGSAFNDHLDSGLGDDTVSGLRGVDVFVDAGGTNTLLETNDADMGLFGNRFVVGQITDLIKGSKALDDEQQPADPLFPVPFVTELAGMGDQWAAGAEVENLLNDDGSSIFARAILKGGDSNNTLVLNDRDNLITVAGVGDLAVTDWTGYTRLDNAANITSPGNLEAGLNEYYILNMKGGSGALVEVEDSGGTAGFNELYVIGTDEREEVYLDRASGHVTAAMIRIGPEGAGRETVLHRYVNRVNIHTLGGDDLVYSDDTAVPVIVRMGDGEDDLIVGTVPQIPDPDNRTIEFPLGVPIADTENMTNGVSAMMVVYGEGGDDVFEVNHNAAKLFLHGGDGDDTFIINTFITLREQTPEGEAIANLNTLFGGTGNNRYDYVQNAPVFINGGAGTDTIIINGTPIADTFVITKNSVAGAGRVTYFTGVEILEVNGAGGDDEFYVLSTDPNLELVIRGGSGDDTVHLGGEHAPILFDPPPFTYQPPAFQVQDPAIVEYDRYTYDPGRITLTRDFGWLSSSWHQYWSNPTQFARNVVSSWIFNWLFGFEIRPFSDVLVGDPNDVAVQGLTDDARANQGFLGLGGIFDLINRTLPTVQVEEISPWWFFWFDDRVSISFDMPAFTYRIGEEFLPPPRIIQPAEVTVDPPAFAYKLDGVFDIKDIQGKLTIDGGDTFETLGDKLVVHNQQGTVHTGTLTGTSLTGFGLGQGTVNGEAYDGIEYENLEFVDLRLSDSATPDVLTIEGTHANPTRVVLGGGHDIVHVKGVGGTLDILGGAGNDTVNVHDDGSTLGGIASRVTFDGDAHIQEQVFTLPYDPAIHAPIIAASPYVYIQTDPNAPGSLVFNPAPGTGSSFRYQQESKAQIVFVKDLNANGVADVGDEVWVRAAEVSADTHQRGRQEVGHQERGILNANGSITVTDNEGDPLVWLTAAGARTLTDTGFQSISVTNAGEAISLPGDVPIYLTDAGRRTTDNTAPRQSILVTNLASDGLLYLDANRQPTTAVTGTPFIAGGILVENRVQERGVQEVGFQMTGGQEHGFQQRGHQSTGAVNAFGDIVITNDPLDGLVFQEANGDLTFIDTGIQHVSVTNDAADALLFLDFRSRLTTVDTGTQAVETTGDAGDALLWRDANGKRTTTNTGIQSIGTTNSAADAKIWVDANGNLTTVAGNAAAMNGSVQARGVHERTSSQQLLYLTANGTETTAVTDRPKITVTNGKFDELLYFNASGHLTTDAGNKMAIRSAASAAQLGAHDLAVVQIWVEDDNDTTTTNTQFKSFTGTPDGKVPGTSTAAPLLWLDQAGRKVDVFFEQFDLVFSGGVNQNVLIYRSRPSLIEVQSSIDRPILHTQDLHQTIAGDDTLNVVHLVPDNAHGTLDTYTRAVDQVVDQQIALHAAGDPANWLGGEAVRDGDPVVVVDGGVLKLRLDDGTLADFPGPDEALPANVLRYSAGMDGVVRYAGGEPVFNEFTLQPVLQFAVDAEGNAIFDEFGLPVQVQVLREAGDPVLHYSGERQYHLAGERREYLGDEPVFGQDGRQVRDVLNNVILQQAGAPVLGGQPVIVRLDGQLYLERVGGELLPITPATDLPVDVLRWAPPDPGDPLDKGEKFYAGGEPVYHANTDPVQANREFARLITDGLPAQLDWVGVDHINVTLGDGDNDFTVERTGAGHITLNLQGGADHVRVKSISGDLTINGGDGDDVVDVWNDDARLYDIDATLTFNGGAPSASDTLNIANTLDFDGTPGALSATALTGLGMDGAIVYGTVEVLNLALGVGDDDLTILSTHASTQTNVSGDVGNDVITVEKTGGETNVFTGEGADTVNVGDATSLAGIAGDLTITADLDALGDGLADILNVTDNAVAGRTGPFAGLLEASQLTGLAMTGAVTYGGFETLNLMLGGGGDELVIASSMAGLTNVSGRGGNDQIKVETVDGTLHVDLGEGDDAITVFDGDGDAAGDDASLTIDTHVGNDTVTLNLGRNLGLPIEVLSSGDPDDPDHPGAGEVGFDELIVNGTSGADRFFLDSGDRSVALSAGVIVTAFPVDDPGADRVAYRHMDLVTLRTHGGDDFIQVDDNAVETVIEMGAGNDLINIATVTTFIDEFGVEVVDPESTTAGTSAPMTVFGNEGDDEFNVFHNQAELFLYGDNLVDDPNSTADDGDDVFAVFTFLVRTDEANATVNLTTISGGGGSNSYEYLQNAPVEIVGGGGSDTLTITGTGLDDVFVVTDTFIAGAGRQLLLNDDIENIIVNGAGGNDQIYVLGTKAGSITTVRGGSGDDTIHLGGDHPVLVFDPPPSIVQPPSTQKVELVVETELVTVDPAPFARVVSLAELPIIAALNAAGEVLRYGGVVTNTKINFFTQRINVFFTTITISVPVSVTITIDPPEFTRTVERLVPVVTTVTPDPVVVDQPPFAFKVDAVHDLTGIQGKLVIEGGDAVESAGDRMIVHDELGAGTPGVLTADTLTGQGLGTPGVEYHELEAVEMRLGNADDHVTVESTHPGTTQLMLGGGDDHVRVKTIAGDTTIWGGAGDDTVEVWDDAQTLAGIDANLTFHGDKLIGEVTVNWADALDENGDPVKVPATPLVVDAAGNQYHVRDANGDTAHYSSGPAFVKVAQLDPDTGEVIYIGDPVDKIIATRTIELPYPEKQAFFEENSPGSDFFHIRTDGDPDAPSGLLTGATLTGLNLENDDGAVTLFDVSIEEMLIELGDGDDVFFVQGTEPLTRIRTGGGNDRVVVGNAGSLDDIEGELFIDAQGGDHNVLVIDDSADPDADTVEVTADTITGLSPALIHYSATGGAYGSVYDPLTGQFSAGIEILAGTGDDTINALSSRNTPGLVEVTRIDAGAGDDEVFIDDPDARYLEVHGGSGDDTIAVLADAGFGGVTVFGDEGDDTITGGAGADVLVGGLGVDTIDGGAGADVIVGDDAEIRRDADYVVQRIAGLADAGDGDDILAASVGNDVIIGGGGADRITALSDGSIIIGDAGVVVFADGSADEWDVFSIASGAGGDDIIQSGADSIVLGGAGEDEITLGGGFNVVIGDTGVVRRSGPGVVTQVATDDATGGARDTITTAGGTNIILGGLGGDFIDAAEGTNVILGDNGVANFGHDGSWDIFSTDPDLGGDDVIEGGADNIIIGGAGADTITLGGGTNTVLGDEGIVRRSGPLTVTQVATTGTSGAGDTITVTGASSNIIIGGAGGDGIDAAFGTNVVLGDNGTANFGHDGSWDIFSTALDVGGDDVIEGGADNIIIGGAGADEITAQGGLNTILGDNGVVERTAGGVVARVYTLDEDGLTGGDDEITLGDGTNIVLGGMGADTIDAPGGVNIILGDNGEVNVGGDVFSTQLDKGGDDIITAGSNNTILGGAGADIITAEGGFNTILGDNGVVERTAGGVVARVYTLDEDGLTGGDDEITLGDGTNIVLGGMGADTIDAPGGVNIILGDNGEVNVGGDVFSTQLDQGGDDVITAGSNNTILGGFGADTITLGSGTNTVLGDNGIVRRNAADEVTQVATTDIDAATGGADAITSAGGVNIIIGGLGADLIDAAAGSNVVLGDNGVANFGHEGSWDIFTTDFGLGGDDVITGGADNVILGGFGADLITLGGGTNIVLGDNGVVERAGATGYSSVYTTDTDAATGGDDEITSNGGDNVLIGGLGNDLIHAAAGINIILGDNGRVDADGNVYTTEEWLGGDDEITGGVVEGAGILALSAAGAGEANNIILGGHGADTITLGSGTNIVLGDNGVVVRVGGVATSVFTSDTDASTGGDDAITSLGGTNIILGGVGSDRIAAPFGTNVILGDNGVVTLEDGAPVEVRTTDPLLGGDDVITGGVGDNIVLGGAGADLITGGEGNDILVGDNGVVDLSGAQPVVTSFDEDGEADYIDGGAGDDVLYGGGGDDVLIGGLGHDRLHGQAGNDILLGDVGQVTASGDVLLLEVASLTGWLALNGPQAPGAEQSVVDGLLQADIVLLAGRYAADGSTDSRALLLELLADGDDTLIGGEGDDALFGQRGNDRLWGEDGADLLSGGAGDDILHGGEGDDTLVGDDVHIDSAAATFPNVTHGLLIDGAAVVPMVSVEPGRDTNAVASVLAHIFGYQDAIPAHNSLALADGSMLVPFASVVTDLAHHLDQLRGNDQLWGEGGNDTLVGDDQMVYARSLTFDAESMARAEAITRALLDVSDDFSDLVHRQYDLLEPPPRHRRPPHGGGQRLHRRCRPDRWRRGQRRADRRRQPADPALVHAAGGAGRGLRALRRGRDRRGPRARARRVRPQRHRAPPARGGGHGGAQAQAPFARGPRSRASRRPRGDGQRHDLRRRGQRPDRGRCVHRAHRRGDAGGGRLDQALRRRRRLAGQRLEGQARAGRSWVEAPSPPPSSRSPRPPSSPRLERQGRCRHDLRRRRRRPDLGRQPRAGEQHGRARRGSRAQRFLQGQAQGRGRARGDRRADRQRHLLARAAPPPPRRPLAP